MRAFSPYSFLIVLCFVAGCSSHSATSVEWNLGDEGKSVFYYLVQQEAAAAGDEEAFKASSEQLLALSPDAQIFMDAAEFALRRRDWAEARNIARKGLEQYPDQLQLVLVVTDSYMQERRANDAVDTLGSFVKAWPGNQDALLEFSRLLMLTKRHADLDALVQKLPAGRVPPFVRFMHARSLLDRGNLTRGEQELRSALRQDPDMMDAWVDLAMCLQLRGNNLEAANLYRQALDRDPDNLPLWLRLVDAYARAKRPELALKALDLAPASTPLQLEAGVLLLEAKHYSAARKVLNRVKNSPDAPEEIYFYLAALIMESGQDTNEALSMLEQVPADNRLAERALRWRLQLLEDAGRGEESLMLAQSMAAEKFEVAAYQLIYAQTLSRMQKADQSIKVLRAALQRWPNDTSLMYHLAYGLDPLGEREEALRLMEAVIAREPRNAGALNYVGYTLAEAGRDLDRAHALLQRAVAEAPEDPHIVDSLAWVHYQMGNFQEAWKAIRKSVSLGGDHAVIWEHYGDIAVKINNKAEAGKGYRNALKAKPDDPESIRKKLQGLP